ncbi:MAG: neutral zinc metallopeptidase [Bacteroidales bacterium]|nr:neutral zinc metallopeptidase [Bacteroidales bacterium]
MRFDGRRRGSNVEDRRGMSAGKKGGLGLGGIIVVGLLMWIFGGNPLDALKFANSGSVTGGGQEYVETKEDAYLMDFSAAVLAGTEDVWTKLFQQNGLTYRAPKLVVFNGAVQSACGGATSQTGPFYCSADETVYIDLSFFKEMEKSLGAKGDFAWAYVIAHEVGHHVQHLLGVLDKVHSAQQSAGSQKEANRLSVRLELQADFYAGIWAYYDNKRFGSLEDGDIEEGLNAATAIGDDRLQKQAQGYAVPDSFNHGTSDQRMRWLKKGLTTGDLSLGDSFSVDYNRL